jgi:hypothetical protein
MADTTNIFLVLLKTDGNGSAIVACTELAQDPLFPNQVILGNTQGLSWPFQGRFLGVRQWSVNKDSVINWMVGPLQQAPELTQELLEGKGQQVPWPPGSLPTSELVTDPKALQPREQPVPSVPEQRVSGPLIRPITVLGR